MSLEAARALLLLLPAFSFDCHFLSRWLRSDRQLYSTRQLPKRIGTVVRNPG